MNRSLYWGLLVALIIAALLSPLAASDPDGLERVAEYHNFLAESQNLLKSPIPDYVIPGIDNDVIATSLAGAIGVLLTFGVTLGLKKFLVKNKETRKPLRGDYQGDM